MVLRLKPVIIPFICFAIFQMVLTGPAVATELKIATLSPEGSPWMQKMRAGAEEIAQKTNNRVRFKFFPGGVMGNDKAVMRKIRVGQLHGGVLTGGSLSRAFRDAQVYSLPLKFRNLQEVDYVRTQMDPILTAGYEKGGFVNFGLAGGGFAYVMSNEPVRSIEDLRNQKVWIPDHDPTISEVINAFGIKSISLPIADVRTGLQTGLIDTVTISPLGAIVLQWHTQVKYLTDLPMVYVFGLLAVDRRAFSKISTEDQDFVRSTMGRVFQEIDRQNRTDNVEALSVLRNLGIKFIRPDDSDQDNWRKAAADVTKRLIDSGVVSKQMANALDKNLEDFRAGGQK
jgi:TRAP-type transport system periplasmic protein